MDLGPKCLGKVSDALFGRFVCRLYTAGLREQGPSDNRSCTLELSRR